MAGKWQIVTRDGKKCYSQQGDYKLYWNKLNKYSETNLANILRKLKHLWSI